MSLAPAPILHNGVLNTTFNASDFNNASKLNSTNVTGPLTVSGLATFNSGTQVNGTENVTGTVVCNTSTVNANQTVGGTSTITGLTTCNGGIATNNTVINAGTGSITGGITTCSGLITATNGLTLGSNKNITLASPFSSPTAGTQLGGVTSTTFSAVSLGSNTTSTQSITVPNDGVYLIITNVNYKNTSATAMTGSFFSSVAYCNTNTLSVFGGQFNYSFSQNQSAYGTTTDIVNTLTTSNSKTMGINIYSFYTGGTMVVSGTINAVRIA